MVSPDTEEGREQSCQTGYLTGFCALTSHLSTATMASQPQTIDGTLRLCVQCVETHTHGQAVTVRLRYDHVSIFEIRQCNLIREPQTAPQVFIII